METPNLSTDYELQRLVDNYRLETLTDPARWESEKQNALGFGSLGGPRLHPDEIEMLPVRTSEARGLLFNPSNPTKSYLAGETDETKIQLLRLHEEKVSGNATAVHLRCKSLGPVLKAVTDELGKRSDELDHYRALGLLASVREGGRRPPPTRPKLKQILDHLEKIDGLALFALAGTDHRASSAGDLAMVLYRAKNELTSLYDGGYKPGKETEQHPIAVQIARESQRIFGFATLSIVLSVAQVIERPFSADDKTVRKWIRKGIAIAKENFGQK